MLPSISNDVIMCFYVVIISMECLVDETIRKEENRRTLTKWREVQKLGRRIKLAFPIWHSQEKVGKECYSHIKEGNSFFFFPCRRTVKSQRKKWDLISSSLIKHGMFVCHGIDQRRVEMGSSGWIFYSKTCLGEIAGVR